MTARFHATFEGCIAPPLPFNWKEPPKLVRLGSGELYVIESVHYSTVHYVRAVPEELEWLHATRGDRS